MSNAAPIKLRQVRDLGEVISTTFSYVKLHFRKLYTALLLACLPGMLIGGLLINSFFSSLATGMGRSTAHRSLRWHRCSLAIWS